MNAHTQSVTFRKAHPDDAEIACPLIYSAGPREFDYIFGGSGRDPMDFLRYAYRDGAGFFGYRNHTVALVNGSLAGIGAFYSGMEYLPLGLSLFRQMFSFFGMGAARGVIARSMRTARLMPTPGIATEYIANVGVVPELHGRGIGTRLLDHHRGVAITRGKKRYALDVSSYNPNAQRLYERLGFRVACGNSMTDATRGITFTTSRMTMDLPSS